MVSLCILLAAAQIRQRCDLYQVPYQLVVGFMDRRLDLPERLKTQIASIVEDCWQTDPAKRPSFEVIISRMMSLFCKAGSSAQEEED
ncbi:BnaA09g13210D [Brassica napus]|uniref:BnaA09g13210D protein n=1 Tax=Brassica napus TaxID=3708 RepID=A0A078FL89_BRANA|nr:BnaA09g13210D [Brassica napus]